MDYAGFAQEQAKAQIRSTRGETIDLALPLSCTVGELRSFLIEEYNYDPNTRLLYNGSITNDNTYVCDYPFGSLMIATPADMQPQRQPLPPRQMPQPFQQQQQQQPVRTSPRTSPRPASNSARKGKAQETGPANTNAARKSNQPDGGSPEAARKGKHGGPILKHPPKKSPRVPRSGSAESNGSNGAPPPSRAANTQPPPAPVDAPSPTPLAATRDRGSPSHNSNNMGSGRNQTSHVNSARNPGSARASAATQDAVETSPSQQQQQQQQPSASTTQSSAPHGDDDERTHRLRVRFTVECHIPSLKKVVPVLMNGESTVVDLVLAVVAEAPEIGGEAQVVFRGKILPQNARSRLFDMGMRADTRVFIAAGEYSNPETITLLEIEKDTAEIDKAMKSTLTDLQRKGYYEELMRILFRTDGLLSLEGEWRQRRKDAVKRITALQDALGIESKNV